MLAIFTAAVGIKVSMLLAIVFESNELTEYSMRKHAINEINRQTNKNNNKKQKQNKLK